MLATVHQYIWPEWLGKLLGKIQEKRVDYRVWTILGNKNNLHGGLYWKLHIWAFSLRSSFSRKICLVVWHLHLYLLCSVKVLCHSRHLRRDSEMSLSSEKSNLNHSFAEINMITISPEIIKSSTFLLKETLQI